MRRVYNDPAIIRWILSIKKEPKMRTRKISRHKAVALLLNSGARIFAATFQKRESSEIRSGRFQVVDSGESLSNGLLTVKTANGDLGAPPASIALSLSRDWRLSS